MYDNDPIFQDRRASGRVLARELEKFRAERPIVVGLPRGGVIVAAEVARALGAPLDACVVRKIGAPWRPELGLGAVAEGGEIVLAPPAARVGASDEEIAAIASRELREVAARIRRLRGDGAPLDVTGRTVIVVDDGIATGWTARAALRTLRKCGAARLIFAAPVGAAPTIAKLRGDADDVVCPFPQDKLGAVGLWYVEFEQVGDEEVIAALGRRPRVASGSDAVRMDVDGVSLEGDLSVPPHAIGLVLFAHGSGSSRQSPRNRMVAAELNRAGVATLLFDLLTKNEERVDMITRRLRFDIDLLADRLVAATTWAWNARGLPIAYFGASTGAAAALIAASERPQLVRAVVSRGGRPDLAAEALARVEAPTLLIVGGDDDEVLALNREALAQLHVEKDLAVVPGATHLFEEPGALEHVARLATGWFVRHFGGGRLARSA